MCRCGPGAGRPYRRRGESRRRRAAGRARGPRRPRGPRPRPPGPGRWSSRSPRPASTAPTCCSARAATTRRRARRPGRGSSARAPWSRSARGSTGLAVGDRVCALLDGGGYAERVAVRAGQVLPLPDGVDLVEAAALPEAAATVHSTVVGTARAAGRRDVPRPRRHERHRDHGDPARRRPRRPRPGHGRLPRQGRGRRAVRGRGRARLPGRRPARPRHGADRRPRRRRRPRPRRGPLPRPARAAARHRRPARRHRAHGRPRRRARPGRAHDQARVAARQHAAGPAVGGEGADLRRRRASRSGRWSPGARCGRSSTGCCRWPTRPRGTACSRRASTSARCSWSPDGARWRGERRPPRPPARPRRRTASPSPPGPPPSGPRTATGSSWSPRRG